jgi:hypothetical protein
MLKARALIYVFYRILDPKGPNYYSGGAVPDPTTTTRGEERQCAATRAAATGAPAVDRWGRPGAASAADGATGERS